MNSKGAIQGIPSSDTTGHSAECKIASVAAFDPIGYLFTTVSATTALGFAEPEILYPSGTEMQIEFLAPLITSTSHPSAIPTLVPTEEERAELVQFVRGLSFRTNTKGTNKPSDLTNLLLTARRVAAGVQGSRLGDFGPTHRRHHVPDDQKRERQPGLHQGPMSTVLLDEHEPILTLTQTTNTFFLLRHHLRVFDPDVRFQGLTALIGLQYGAEFKVRVHPCITVRADFRETLSKNPRFIQNSYTTLDFLFEGYDAQIFKVDPPAKYRQQRFLLGAAFTF